MADLISNIRIEGERAASPTAVLGVLAALLVVVSAAAPRPITAPSPCALPEADLAWVQEILDGWTLVTRDFLGIDPEPLPRMVLFDSVCAWDLGPERKGAKGREPAAATLRFGGGRVRPRGRPHEGRVRLPDGSEIPADVIAVAVPYRGGEDAFLALALPELWKRRTEDPHVEVRILSVALHEMIHTRQLPTLRRRVVTLGERYELPSAFDDDVIENRFRDVPGYRPMYEQERDLLYEAVAESHPARRDSLVGRALSIARERRRSFMGDDEPYGEIEGLFLNMEGIAEWARFRYHRHHRARPGWPTSRTDVLRFLRGSENSWSQDEGLALVLLLEETAVPGWRERMLGPEMASPFDLLDPVTPSGGSMVGGGAP